MTGQFGICESGDDVAKGDELVDHQCVVRQKPGRHGRVELGLAQDRCVESAEDVCLSTDAFAQPEVPTRQFDDVADGPGVERDTVVVGRV